MSGVKYQVVARGIDTLQVNALGRFAEYMPTLLDAIQGAAIAERDARRSHQDVLVASYWELDGQPLLMRAHGGGGGLWKWLLTCPAASFALGTGSLNGICCQVRLASPFLWEHGYRAAWALVRDLLDTWGEFTYQPSEVHLCADVAGKAHAALREADFIRRGHVVRWYVEDAMVLDLPAAADAPVNEVIVRYRQQETLNFSLTAPHAGVVYDKPREIRTKSRDKGWFGDIWRANGWDDTAPVVRVEFRYEREVLHEMGIETMDDLFARLDELWAYSSQQWLRHTVPTGDKNRSRWPTSAWWRTVQGATFERADALPAVRERVRRFQEARMLAALLGYVESWAAWRAGDVTPDDLDLSTVLRDIAHRADKHYVDRASDFLAQVRRKRQQIGFSK